MIPQVPLLSAYHSTETVEPSHDKASPMADAPSEGSDQPGHPPSLIRAVAVHMKIVCLE